MEQQPDRTLVVDDDLVSLNLIANEILKPLGYDVAAAAEAKQSVDTALAPGFDQLSGRQRDNIRLAAEKLAVLGQTIENFSRTAQALIATPKMLPVHLRLSVCPQ